MRAARRSAGDDVINRGENSSRVAGQPDADTRQIAFGQASAAGQRVVAVFEKGIVVFRELDAVEETEDLA